MMVRVVTFSAIFLAAKSVVAAAETRDDGGRLDIGQGANSCWAWTWSHEERRPKVCTGNGLRASCQA